MGTTIQDRAKMFIRFKEMNTSQFERKIGVSSGYVKNISKGIGWEKLERIKGVFPELNTDWLLTGVGQMLNESTPNSAISGEQNEKKAEKSNTIQQGISGGEAGNKQPSDNEVVLALLQTIHNKDLIITQQAAELRQQSARIARLEAELQHAGNAVSDADCAPTAHVG